MTAPQSPPPAISLDAAEALTGVSRRTLWRRVADGTLISGAKDARGRTTLLLAGLLPLMQEHLGRALERPTLHQLLLADGGNVRAQTDLGALLYGMQGERAAATRQAALYWLQQAAAQEDADAMHWLGLSCASMGTEQGDREALMWMTRAATLGHVIAQGQVAALMDAVVTDTDTRTGDTD